ncbi:MAG: hypothetical protein JJ902_05285 [Roseibium sp.]|nr:hypothetical protein [Roseibium sp.]
MGRRRYSDATLFIAYALWVKGHTETTIAMTLGLGRKQVSGIIGRSPFSNRTAMSDDERQDHLSDLKAIHFDQDAKTLRCGGRLKTFDWTILPLLKDQRNRRSKG